MLSIRVIDTVKGRSSLTGKADYDGRASVNIRGFSTLRQPKNSMTVRLKDENEDKVKTGLLGLPKESDWGSLCAYSDKTLIRDVLAYELSNKMGRYAPRTRLVELYLDRSGGRLGQRDYMGVYVLVEKIKRGKSRVNITELVGSDRHRAQHQRRLHFQTRSLGAMGAELPHRTGRLLLLRRSAAHRADAGPDELADPLHEELRASALQFGLSRFQPGATPPIWTSTRSSTSIG